MKNKYNFNENEYTARARLKPDKWEMIKTDAKKQGFISAAALLDHIIDDYYKPNLFKNEKSKSKR